MECTVFISNVFIFIIELLLIIKLFFVVFCSGPVSRNMYHKVMIDVPQDLRQLLVHKKLILISLQSVDIA